MVLGCWSPQDLIPLFLCLAPFLEAGIMGSRCKVVALYLNVVHRVAASAMPASPGASRAEAGSSPASWGHRCPCHPPALPGATQGWAGRSPRGEGAASCRPMAMVSPTITYCIWVCCTNSLLPFFFLTGIVYLGKNPKKVAYGEWGLFVTISLPSLAVCRNCLTGVA